MVWIPWLARGFAPWSPFFNSEQAIVKWPLVTRLLGEGRLNLDLDSLRFWYGRWPTSNPPRIRLIREAEVRGCIVLDGLGMLVSQEWDSEWDS